MFLFAQGAHAQFVLQGPQGGTNIGTGVAGDVGKCLKVLSVGPLKWQVGTCGSGSGGGGGLASTSPWVANTWVYAVDDSTVGASSTPYFANFTATNGTTTTFAISSLTSELLKVNGIGSVLEAVADADYQVPLTLGDGLTRTANDIDCDTANTSTFGCLTDTDWDTFNGKQDALGFTPANSLTTITVAGTANQLTSSAGAQDLSANRTWTLSLPSLVVFPSNASSTLFSSTYASTSQLCIGGDCKTAWPSGGATFSYPFTTLATGEQATSTTMSFQAGFLALASSTLSNATSTNFNVGSSFSVTPLTSAILLTNTVGTLAEYAGTSCTNQFTRTISALGVAGCATVVATDVDLADLTATNGSLTFTGAYDGQTARTVGLNVGNANVWTALQTFTNASSTLFSSTIASTSQLILSGASDGCLNVTSGNVTSTGSACGGGGGFAFPFTYQANGFQATSTGLLLTGGLVVSGTASSTFQQPINAPNVATTTMAMAEYCSPNSNNVHGNMPGNAFFIPTDMTNDTIGVTPIQFLTGTTSQATCFFIIPHTTSSTTIKTFYTSTSTTAGHNYALDMSVYAFNPDSGSYDPTDGVKTWLLSGSTTPSQRIAVAGTAFGGNATTTKTTVSLSKGNVLMVIYDAYLGDADDTASSDLMMPLNPTIEIQI